MKVYILSTYQEDGAERVKATLYKDYVIDMFMSYEKDEKCDYFPNPERVELLKELLEKDEINIQGIGIGRGWGGFMLHIVELSEPPACSAILWHGPGHQSRARCYLKGKHEIHETRYGRDDQTARWKGDKAMSGYFDEPPDDPEEDENG